MDLEVVNGEIAEIGALWGNQELETPVSSSREAVRLLDEFGEGAGFVVGHNVVAHDRRFMEEHLPGSRLLDLPVVDTLYLAPLAKPQQPYHSLVKDYKLIGAEPNDPVADCRIALRLLEDCWELLEEKDRQRERLLWVYRSCFDDSDGPGGTSPLRLQGTGLLLEELGAKKISHHRVVKGFQHFAGERACREAIRFELPDLIEKPETRPAVAYSLAWLTVAGTESVLPRWVHRQFPAASEFVRKIRSVPCRRPECGYCSKHHDPEQKLRHYFGFDEFRATPTTTDGESLQERIVRDGIASQSVLAIMPTGGGKSVGFQLPAIVHNEQRGALTVVISPLQALMKDQVENLNKRTQTPTLAATLNGLQTMIERRDVLEGIRLGRFALLYVSPEQLRSSSFASAIRHREIVAWVFDEAHCISKWGHDFRPDYLYAARFIKEFSDNEGVCVAPIRCFTATAKLDVRLEIRSHFREVLGKDLRELATDQIDRENLHFRVEEIPNSRKVRRIDQLLREGIAEDPETPASGAAIIYARSRHRTEHFADMLQLAGWNAEHFHGGLDPPDKKRVQDAFIGGELPIIVATNAFGMGIDKSNVRLVVHADVPASIESYLQEAGRAGRDGQSADCVLLFAKGDLERQFDLVARGRLTKRDIAQILRAIRAARHRDTEEIIVSPGDLIRTPDTDFSFDEQSRYVGTLVRTAISWLERARFVLRNENRTRLYQGVPAVPDLEESLGKLETLHLSFSKKKRWEQVLRRLHLADLREGIEVDEIACFPSFQTQFKYLNHRHRNNPARANRAFTREIFRTLHEMTRAGVLESGIYFSAWIHHKRGHTSPNRLKQIAEAQEILVKRLREQSPNAGPEDEVEVSIPQLQEQLRAGDLTMVTDGVLALLKGWTRRVVGRQVPVTLQSRGRRRLGMRLEVSWDELGEQLRLRNEVGRVVLAVLGNTADQHNLVGQRLVRFSLEELHRAVEERLGLSLDLGDVLVAIEKALLFLDENHVIRLEKGLSVFRQAMTLRMHEEAKGKKYSDEDYRPLRDHYQQKMIQIHAIGRYAEDSQTSLGGQARRYVGDYFRLSGLAFNRRYFSGEIEALRRPTSKENYEEIVESLGNEAQQRIITAPKDRNLLVLAGPGSGKTRVVVHRAAYLLMVERIRPERLLVICFNRSAMHELRVRLRELVGDSARRVAVHTYHSLALRLTERSLAERVRAADDDRIDFDEIVREANRRLAGKEEIIGAGPDELRDRLLAGFEYVLVDEYQDIDADQYQMITQIARRAGQEADEDRRATILAVGDDDQNIYAWRRANVRYLRQFESDFGAERHYLVENYRSTRHIIETTNHLIRHNRDRMKVDHPIRINEARQFHPSGGVWQRLDSLTRGRVSRIDVDRISVAEATLAEIERLRKLGEDPRRKQHSVPDWSQFAVLAWSHGDLAPVRALIERKGVPVRRAIPEGLPRLSRIREFRHLLDDLQSNERRDVHIPNMRGDLAATCRVDASGSLWMAMADRMLKGLEEEAGDEPVPAAEVVDAIYQGLADHHRSHIIGEGVLVSTIHAAKGLEFDHVLVLGGLRKGRNTSTPSTEEVRRLYYVAMTRARHTLALIDSRDSPNLYFAEIRKSTLNRKAAVAKSQPSGFVDLRYEVLGMKDLYIDFAGRKQADHRIHRSLRRLQAGDPVTLQKVPNGRVQVLDKHKTPVASLSKAAAKRWSQSRLTQVDASVLGMVCRTQNDSGEPKYRSLLKVESWEVPILEIRERQEKRPRP
ncbi:MAG: RecQ family ATP-dependent DNA helicase [Acidimicrobiia bacterium]|nr:RecQ family ATP-dependent DNA helicase [Acidimicrobiia bacterium]